MRTKIALLLLTFPMLGYANGYSAGLSYQVKLDGLDESYRYYPRGFGAVVSLVNWKDRYNIQASYHALSTDFRTEQNGSAKTFQANSHQLSAHADMPFYQLRQNEIALRISGLYEVETIDFSNPETRHEWTGSLSVLVTTPVSERISTAATLGYQISSNGYYDQDVTVSALWDIEVFRGVFIRPSLGSSLDTDHYVLSTSVDYQF